MFINKSEKSYLFGTKSKIEFDVVSIEILHIIGGLGGDFFSGSGIWSQASRVPTFSYAKCMEIV